MVRSTRQTAPKFEPFPTIQPLPPMPALTPAPVSILPTLTQNTTPIQATNGSVVTHFQPSNRGNQNVIYEEFVTDDYCVDRESVRRKFGWGTLGNTHHIPVVYRNGDKYCAVRMIDKHILESFLTKISDSIYYGCTNIPGYYVTVPESLLLNEINEFHCENFYGTLPFKQNDVLVKLDEANNFYEFLTVCSNKLFGMPCGIKRCGFLRMNNHLLVPYIIMNDQKFLPLFYLDGMEVHGIGEKYWKRDDCSVIMLDELVQHFEPGQFLSEDWPATARTNKTLYQVNKVNQHTVKAWHQHPITVLPVSTVKYSKVMPNNRTSVPTVTTNQNSYYRTISHS